MSDMTVNATRNVRAVYPKNCGAENRAPRARIGRNVRVQKGWRRFADESAYATAIAALDTGTPKLCAERTVISPSTVHSPPPDGTNSPTTFEIVNSQKG